MKKKYQRHLTSDHKKHWKFVFDFSLTTKKSFNMSQDKSQAQIRSIMVHLFMQFKYFFFCYLFILPRVTINNIIFKRGMVVNNVIPIRYMDMVFFFRFICIFILFMILCWNFDLCFMFMCSKWIFIDWCRSTLIYRLMV